MPIGAVVSGCSHSGSMNMIFIVKLGFKSTPHTHTHTNKSFTFWHSVCSTANKKTLEMKYIKCLENIIRKTLT